MSDEGPIFDDAVETIEAIRRVQAHLRKAWIVDGCREHQSWGCVSCQAANLERDLELLAIELIEDQRIPIEEAATA